MSSKGNPFEDLCTDEMTIQKASGGVLGPFKGTFRAGKAVIFEDELDVDEGDKILRELPGGKVESHTILEVQYSAQFQGIPPCYNLKIRKDTSLLNAMPTAGSNIHITGSQGIQIGDHNTQNIISAFERIVSNIEEANVSEQDKQEAKGRLKAFLSHPLVAAILGAAAGGLASRL